MPPERVITDCAVHIAVSILTQNSSNDVDSRSILQ